MSLLVQVDFDKFEILFCGFIRTPAGQTMAAAVSAEQQDIVCAGGISCRKHLESSSITRMEHTHTHIRTTLHTCCNYLIFQRLNSS